MERILYLFQVDRSLSASSVPALLGPDPFIARFYELMSTGSFHSQLPAVIKSMESPTVI